MWEFCAVMNIDTKHDEEKQTKPTTALSWFCRKVRWMYTIYLPICCLFQHIQTSLCFHAIRLLTRYIWYPFFSILWNNRIANSSILLLSAISMMIRLSCWLWVRLFVCQCLFLILDMSVLIVDNTSVIFVIPSWLLRHFYFSEVFPIGAVAELNSVIHNMM